MANVSIFSAVKNVARRKSAVAAVDGRGWFPMIREAFAGAWQKNMEWTVDTVVAHDSVYACITLISNDFGKLRPKLMRMDENGIWIETTSTAFSPVLRKPNRFQNHIQFKQWWVTSKLMRGNTYALKQRDQRGVVVALYILDPNRVTPLVAPDQSVFYQCGQDNLSGVGVQAMVPASEIIHDRMNCLFHPLVGISPLYASGLAANQGLKIQHDTSMFFANGANPGGVLTAPGAIDDDTAKRLKEYWDTNFTGENAGSVAVLGDGLTFEPMRMTAADAQTVEQLKKTAEAVCSTFHVPPFKIGIGSLPVGQKVGDMNQIYYSDCLQSLIEEFEVCMDEGLALGNAFGLELDTDGLLRMDAATQADTLVKLVGGSISTPNEARKKLGYGPIVGGNTVYLQVQNYSLAALAQRDSTNPLAAPPAPAPVVPAPVDSTAADEAEQAAKDLLEYISKGLAHA